MNAILDSVAAELRGGAVFSGSAELRSSPRIVWICINGILTNPGDAEGWTDRAVTWLNLHTDGKAEKFEYATGALTRLLKQGWRAQAIARMCSFYIMGGYEVVLIAHSNGADLVERVLDLLYPAQIRSAHLFAPACDGAVLARALVGEAESVVDQLRTRAAPQRGAPQLGALHLYGSENDGALRLGHLSRLLASPVNGLLSLVDGPRLGYGDLGRRITRFAEENIGAIAHEDPTQTHGSWWERGRPFERTMRAIVRNENLGL